VKSVEISWNTTSWYWGWMPFFMADEILKAQLDERYQAVTSNTEVLVRRLIV